MVCNAWIARGITGLVHFRVLSQRAKKNIEQDEEGEAVKTFLCLMSCVPTYVNCSSNVNLSVRTLFDHRCIFFEGIYIYIYAFGFDRFEESSLDSRRASLYASA